MPYKDRDVQRAYQKRWDREKLARRRRWLQKYKMEKGCEMCGYKEHPAALHFDHLDPATKVAPVANMMKRPIDILVAEIRKCRILCANCHAVHTITEKHHIFKKDVDIEPEV